MYVRIRSVNIKDSYREGMESYLYLAPSSTFYSFFDLYTSRICACVTTCVHTSMCTHSHVHIWSFPRYLGTFIQLSSLEVPREKKAAFSVVSLKCSTDFSPMELCIWERWECLFSPSNSSSWYRILLHCLGTLAILKVCHPHPCSLQFQLIWWVGISLSCLFILGGSNVHLINEWLTLSSSM